jgi:hypothetical protein
MSPQLLSPNREAAIWARLMQAQTDELSPEVAEYLLSIGFGESDRDRMQQLAERSESGILTDEERAEFDSYLSACWESSRCHAIESQGRSASKAGSRAQFVNLDLVRQSHHWATCWLAR